MTEKRAARPTRPPAWATELSRQIQAIGDQQVRDRLALTTVQESNAVVFRSIADRLGEEPDADGSGGRGLIGDIRRLSRDLQSISDLRAKGLGFLVAVGLFGAAIVGLVQLVQAITSTLIPGAAK